MTDQTTPPAYCRQRRPNGLDNAFIKLVGRKIYLGRYGSKESKAKYVTLVAEYEARGR